MYRVGSWERTTHVRLIPRNRSHITRQLEAEKDKRKSIKEDKWFRSGGLFLDAMSILPEITVPVSR